MVFDGDTDAPSIDASHYAGMLVILAIVALAGIRYWFDS